MSKKAKTSRRNFIIYLVASGFVLFAIFYLLPFDQPTEIPPTINLEVTSPIVEEKIPPAPDDKPASEVFVQGLDTAIKIGQTLYENKKRRDSIIMANRPEKWAYQIGAPKDDKQVVFETVKELSDIENISVFRVSGKYYIIRYDAGLSQQELEREKSSFKEEVQAIRPRDEITIINLMTFCKKRHDIEEDSPLKKRKLRVPCFFCD